MKGNAARPPIARGDHVYIRHPTKGVAAVRVLAVGKDGLTGRCDAGKRRGVPWKHVLGVRKRLDVLAPRERPESPPPPASMAKAAPAAPPAELPKPVPPPPPPSAAERRLADRLEVIDRAARAAEWERWSKRPPSPPPPPPPPAPDTPKKSRHREPVDREPGKFWDDYYDARDRISSDVRARIISAEPGVLIDHVADRANVGRARAAEWVERFMADTDRHLARRRR